MKVAVENPQVVTPPAAPQIPLERPVPEVAPPRELAEVIEDVAADCHAAPDEYLDDVRVPCGGE